MSEIVQLSLIAVVSGAIGAILAQVWMYRHWRADQTAKILDGLREPTWKITKK